MTIENGAPDATGSVSGPSTPTPPTEQERAESEGQSPGCDDRERVFLVVVDSSAEWHSALRFACRRALHTGGRLALLHTIEPMDFQHWMAVEQKMRTEIREEAEARLSEVASDVVGLTGCLPIIYVREGNPAEELIKQVDEEPRISILVLAAQGSGDGPGPLISYLVGKGRGRLRIPVTIVPANLSIDDIDALS